MADQVLSVLEFLSNNLSTFVNDEAKLLGGLCQEVQLLSDEFGHMKAFLQAVESEKEDDPRLAVWTKQVREAADGTEDVIDEFMLLFARHRPRGFVGYVRSNFNSIKNLPAHHRLATNLQSIRARIKNISEARLRYESQYGKIPAQISERIPPANIDWRSSKDKEALHAKEARLVGINEPKQYLISQLLEGDSQLKVIAVQGMGGIGKTTLVKIVHDDAAVKSHFPIRAWVTISQTYDFKELLKYLIRKLNQGFKDQGTQYSLTPPSMESMDIDELEAHINDFLQQARYAIVFDDIWDNNFWEAFKFILPENSYGGNRVMITTRIADVASSSCIHFHGYVFKMEFLTPQESMTLFCRKTFKDNCCPAHLKNVVEGIVQKCEGLPLAIVAISGVLATKDLSRVDEWERFRRRLGDEFEGTGKLDRAKKILSLSYNDLPPTLKTCLLYTSIYPEDCHIDCFSLIQWWITERFVEQRAGFSTEEVAWGYLKELANRSLIIQSGEIRYDGLLDSIQIHDLLREVIVSKSREINLMTVISTTEIRWPPEKLVRRLILHGNLLFNNFVTVQESHQCFDRLRSVIIFECTEPPSKALLYELLSSKFLKQVCFVDMQLEEIPKEIFNLFLLTYLDLRGTRVKIVPKSIKRLQNLEYLNLVGTNVRELPVEILKLQKFRCLLLYQLVDSSNSALGSYGFKVPRNMGALLGIEILDCIDAAENDKTRIVTEIGKLAQLRYLGITNVRREYGRELCSSLEKLTHLQELRIAYSDKSNEGIILDLNHPISASSLQSIGFLRLHGLLEKMPLWITNLQNLGDIHLICCNLWDDPLESLQHLPNLIRIYLNQAYQGESLCFRAGGFLKLWKLCLREMKGMRRMRVEEGAMPHLKELILFELPLLEELHLGIEHLRELQKLELWKMSSELTRKLENAVDDCEEESEAYKRIAHIPEIRIISKRDGRWFRRLLFRKK